MHMNGEFHECTYVSFCVCVCLCVCNYTIMCVCVCVCVITQPCMCVTYYPSRQLAYRAAHKAPPPLSVTGQPLDGAPAVVHILHLHFTCVCV